MHKRHYDPFLAQTSAMLLILLITYAFGGDTAALADHLIIAAR